MLYGPQFLVCSAYSVLSAAMSLGARLEPRVARNSSISCLIVAQSQLCPMACRVFGSHPERRD